jgi:hypothetical protein
MVDEACRRVQASGVELPAIQCPFQEEACFAEVAAEVRRRFRLDPIRPAVPPGKTPVAVHVRRGDYVGHPRLDVTTPDYFSNAMAYVTARLPSAHFVFVSEDPEWCRANFKGPNVTIAPPTDEAEALRTIVGCEAQIISNSTFGWWGAWLAGTDLVVAPDRWHRQEGAYGPWEPVPARWHRVGGTAASDDRAVVIHGEEPRHERAIVYPWNHRQAKWEELRYSLRSVERFFEDKNCPIYILGTERPGWLLFDEHRVRYINRWSYEEALNDGVQLAEKVLWMNDDILLLRPTTWDDCAVPYYLGTLDQGWVDTAAPKDNPWRKGVVRVMKQLREMGMTELRIYSTHMPYVYERVKAIEVLGEFGLWRKMPRELAYFHMHPRGAAACRRAGPHDPLRRGVVSEFGGQDPDRRPEGGDRGDAARAGGVGTFYLTK